MDNNITPLYHAIINNQFGRMQEIIQALRCDIDTMNNQKEKLLLVGLQNGSNNEIVSTLIKYGCNINNPDMEGNTPLHYAVKRDTVDIMHLLMEMGADVNARNDNGCTPLHVAAKYSKINVLQEVLRSQFVKIDERNESGETPLYVSLFENRPDEIVSALIDAGSNVNVTTDWWKNTPLHLAVLRKSKTIAYKLIDGGADINAQDSRRGLTPLHMAVRKCSDEKFVSSLIDRVNDVNILDRINYTPLHYAAYRQSMFIARKLIEKGANMDFVNFEGDTLLHHAVHVDDLEFLCMLLYYNAPTNEVNRDGRTPFFKSVCFYGFDDNTHGKEIFRSLINYVTDINHEDEDHITVLHMALMYNYDIALDILENDADVNKLFKGTHALYSAWTGHSSYDVLTIVWEKTDFKIFLTSEVSAQDSGKSFLNIFCEHCMLETENFLRYLFMMFKSTYIEYIVQPRNPEIEEYLIRSIICDRDLTSDQRVDVLSVFLSFGVRVYFKDVCVLYEKYGFDEGLELLLMSGCYIYPGVADIRRASPLIYRICYDGKENSWNNYLLFERFFEKCVLLDERLSDQELIEQDPYYQFYRATVRKQYEEVIFNHGVSSTGEVCSLLEISRNAVRKWIYRRCRTFYSFNAYHVMSKLPVPTAVKDILYLKKPIYKNT